MNIKWRELLVMASLKHLTETDLEAMSSFSLCVSDFVEKEGEAYQEFLKVRLLVVLLSDGGSQNEIIKTEFNNVADINWIDLTISALVSNDVNYLSLRGHKKDTEKCMVR